MPATGSYSVDRSRFLPRAGVLFIAAIALPLFAYFAPNVEPAKRFLLWVAAGGAGLLLLGVAPLLFGRRPLLVVSDEGVRVSTISDATIPWLSVTAIDRTKFRGTDTLSLTVDAATSQDLPRRGLARLFPRTRRLTVPLTLLRQAHDDVAADIESRWQGAKATAGNSHAFVAPPAAAALNVNRPWATYALLALLVAVYACELAFPVSPGKGGSPSLLTLAYLGANVGDRIWVSGEWWRLFTAPLLHASPTHILLNGVVLWLAGTGLERLVGWRWLGAIFALSALGGSFGSLAMNPPQVIGVGASGGIMGLLAAMFVMSWRLPPGPQRTRLQIRAGQTIVPSLLPFLANRHTGMTIDYAAHGGGVIIGAIVAAALLWLWPRERGSPPFGLAAACVTGAYFVVAAGSIDPIVHFYIDP